MNDWVDVLNTIVVFSIMFAVGCALKIEDFKSLLRNPRPWLLGMTFQMIFLPLLAFILAIILPIDPVYKCGLFILSLCPGGTMSNFICLLFKGDLALSISLTTVNSLLILITIPVFTNFGLNYFLGHDNVFSLPYGETFLRVLLIILLPALLGFLLRLRKEKAADKFQAYLKFINLGLLAFVYGFKFLAGKESGGSGFEIIDIINLFPAVILLHLISMFCSRYISLAFRLNNKKATTIGIEVGLQNTTLALLICASFIGNEEMAKPALLTGVIAFFTTASFAYYYLRNRITSE